MSETDAKATCDLSNYLASAGTRAESDRVDATSYARLLARLETMPVIEQAKGIIMARSRCAEAEAFDLLRRASQRSNIPVRDLAAQIVARATSPPAAKDRTAPPAPQHQACRVS
ncbi:MAG TPA: ANTAR domain-containing protein [Streptosporangiaceae bacterium]|nr:ANTAR domain-containing protein [Streptosporangiaceae bacterium]